MTYNPAIPQSADLISNSQGEILENFFQLNSQFGIDHSAYETGGSNGNGFHKQVTLPTSTSPTATGIQGIYHQTTAGSGFFNGVALPQFANATADYPLIGNIITTALSGADWTGTLYSFKQGNIIYNFGQLTITDAVNAPHTADIIFPAGYTYTGVGTFSPTFSLLTANVSTPQNLAIVNSTHITITKMGPTVSILYSFSVIGY